MKVLTGSEEVEIPVEEITERPTNALAARVFKLAENLDELVMVADTLESGLDTQAKIHRTSVALRGSLRLIETEVNSIRKDTLTKRKALLLGIGEVQKAASKAALAAKIAEDTKKLEAM